MGKSRETVKVNKKTQINFTVPVALECFRILNVKAHEMFFLLQSSRLHLARTKRVWEKGN
jgi:hypothetical protein